MPATGLSETIRPSAAAPSSPPSSADDARVGALAGLAAYLVWGFIPLYFKLLTHVRPIVIVSHRIVWSALFVALVLAAQRRQGEVLATLRSRRALATLAASTALIAVNWFTYIWAVAHARVVEAGLGYFINPLVNVLLGIVFLRERLRAGQAAALLLAAAGVAVQIVALGHVPWVALTLAVSFSLYALFRKVTPAGPLVGLFVETVLLLPVALLFVAATWQATTFSRGTYALLAASGVVTAVPLLLFATAARRVRLATMGFLQFLSPTCQLLLAVLAFHEPFTRWHLASFALIWAGLLLYSLDSLRSYRAAAASGRNQEPATGLAVAAAEL
jgi:chloramphenicol-sensitive protein RarD